VLRLGNDVEVAVNVPFPSTVVMVVVMVVLNTVVPLASVLVVSTPSVDVNVAVKIDNDVGKEDEAPEPREDAEDDVEEDGIGGVSDARFTATGPSFLPRSRAGSCPAAAEHTARCDTHKITSAYSTKDTRSLLPKGTFQILMDMTVASRTETEVREPRERRYVDQRTVSSSRMRTILQR